MPPPWQWNHCCFMMTSSNGNIFRVTGPLCGEFTGPGEFPTQRPVTRSFDVFCDLRLNKRLSKQPWGWWFETLSRSLWRHRNVENERTCRPAAITEAYEVMTWKRYLQYLPIVRGIHRSLLNSLNKWHVIPSFNDESSWTNHQVVDNLRRHGAHVAWRLMPSHYLNQYWHIITGVGWHFSDSNFTRNALELNP